MEEQVIIVDLENRQVDLVPRSRMRRQRLCHRACYIIVFNDRGELFVQRRTQTKDLYPGRLDLAAGGVVMAGESYDTSAQRELREELGIECGLEPLELFYFDADGVPVWGKLYRCYHNGPFKLQEEEIADGFFMVPEEVLGSAWSDEITPDTCFALKLYLNRAG
jgi:8-oxo-dGTP pyrophosphatase MutT (NUDIX family)